MSGEPLRIALLTYRGNPRSGGQGIYVRLLSRELVELGHHVDVWSGQPYPELCDGVGMVKVPSLDLWNDQAFFRFPTARELRDPINVSEYARTVTGGFPEPFTFSQRVVRTLSRANGSGPKYDILHDNQTLAPELLRLRSKIPLVATIHHPMTRDRRIALESSHTLRERYGLVRWYSFLPKQLRMSRRLDRVMTVSEASADDIAGEYGIARERIRVVGIGIDTTVFHPKPDIQREPDLLVATLSADSAIKGFRYLLEALAILRRERPALRLVVVGSPGRKTHTAKLIQKLGLQDAVQFLGKVEADEIARLYARATLAVVASLYEGFGLPAGEAMACEVPLVATTGGALPEVVGRDGTTGVLVEPGSGEALARGIRDLLDAPEKRRGMGLAAKKRVESMFTWRRAAERRVEVYREAIAERVSVAC
ncbi:MAG: glycosyltransferase family 4 protein [Deltaproteobacteria bacterium]|nr:glycosyltransferase family 4 protein [Deltaproteobacteria bacterium]